MIIVVVVVVIIITVIIISVIDVIVITIVIIIIILIVIICANNILHISTINQHYLKLHAFVASLHTIVLNVVLLLCDHSCNTLSFDDRGNPTATIPVLNLFLLPLFRNSRSTCFMGTSQCACNVLTSDQKCSASTNQLEFSVSQHQELLLITTTTTSSGDTLEHQHNFILYFSEKLDFFHRWLVL